MFVWDGIGTKPNAKTGLAKWDALCEAIRDNGTLRSLGLAHNALGDHGALAVLPAALASPSLTELDLRANGLTLSGLRAITRQLATNGVAWLPRAPLPDASAPPAAQSARTHADVLCPPHLLPGTARAAAQALALT